jgi:glutaredoxin
MGINKKMSTIIDFIRSHDFVLLMKPPHVCGPSAFANEQAGPRFAKRIVSPLERTQVEEYIYNTTGRAYTTMPTIFINGVFFGGSEYFRE